MRIALAKALMCGPDILLLDEPTNYLDIEARNWLEKFLSEFHGGFLLVSHDRYFLDHTINEVYELFNGTLKRYPGNFTHYEEVRKVELNTLIASYEQQQQEISHDRGRQHHGQGEHHVQHTFKHTGQLCDIIGGKNAEEEHRCAADERNAQAVPEWIPVHLLSPPDFVSQQGPAVSGVRDLLRPVTACPACQGLSL